MKTYLSNLPVSRATTPLEHLLKILEFAIPVIIYYFDSLAMEQSTKILDELSFERERKDEEHAIQVFKMCTFSDELPCSKDDLKMAVLDLSYPFLSFFWCEIA